MGKYIKILSVILGVLLVVIAAVPAFSQETTDISTTDVSTSDENTTNRQRPFSASQLRTRTQNAHDKAEELRANARERASDAAQRRAEKLSQARLRICEARAKGIAKRTQFMLTHGAKVNRGHLKIQDRVDEFYNNKLVPQGYVLDNYDELIAEMEANKENVLSLIEMAKENGSTFSCDSEDPKGQLDAFKEDMKEIIDANKLYRESVRNFVRSVLELAKEARADQQKDEEEATPTPTQGEEE